MIRKSTMLAAFLVLVPALATAQEHDAELGKEEFMIACAGCHGESAKGDGPLAALLKIHTPDLTRITERTGGGDFPYLNTLHIIDGRMTIRVHGGDMPVWGERFRRAARPVRPTDMDSNQAELIARGRLMSLVDYLASIQE